MQRFPGRTFLSALAALIFALPAQADEISTVPAGIDRDCRGGRAALYDECGSQMALFRQALQMAQAEGKTLLVSYGAEWCIWCHVFDQYVQGHHGAMTYRYSDPGAEALEQVTLNEKPAADPSAEAVALTRYVADHFVLLHVENYYSADGRDVLRHTGAHGAFDGGLPFIFTVDAQGRYGAHLCSQTVETRRDGWIDWYRGYDRPSLLAELQRMEAAAN